MKPFAVSYSTWLVVIVSLVALFGWEADHNTLAAWLPAIANMTFNTALCFLLIAVACGVLEQGGDRLLAIWFSVFVGAFALLSMAEDGFSISLGIDNLLFDSRNLVAGTPLAGRMSPVTSLGFMLATLGVMALAAWDYWCNRAVMVHALIVLLGLVGLFGVVINLLFGNPPKAYSHFASISLLTAVSFVLVAVSLMRRLRILPGRQQGCGWLYSLIYLMYQLKYPQKFALISLIVLLPFGYLMWNNINAAEQRVAVAKLKMEGLNHLHRTGAILRALAEHRGMTNAQTADASLFHDAIRANEAQIDGLLAANADGDRADRQQIAVPRDWEMVTSGWKRLKHETMSPSERWRLHTNIIAILARHMRTIGDQTGLNRDQNRVLHHLLTAQTVTLPLLLEDIGQQRGLGSRYLAEKKHDAANTIGIGGALGQVQAQTIALDATLDDIFLVGRKLAGVAWTYQSFIEKLKGWIRYSQRAFFASASGSASAEAYFARASRLIAQGELLDDAIIHYVGQQLQQRIRTQMIIQYNIKLASMVLVMVLLLLFTGFYRSVICTINALASSAEKMRHGAMDGPIELPNHDELGEVVEAFNTVASELIRVSSRMRAVIDHAVNAIVMIDATGTIHTFNPAAEAMFGYRAEEVTECNIMQLMPKAFRGEHQAGLARYVASGEAKVVDHVIHVEGLRKGGAVFPVELLIASMEYDGQRWFVGMLRDISEQQQMEARLRYAQKMEAVGSLVGGVAHNFNNMLAGIVGKAYLAKRKAEGNSRIVKDIEAIESVAHKAKDMVTQLLTFAQKDFVHDAQEVSLVDLVTELIARYNDGTPAGVAIVLTVHDQGMVVHCDADKIAQLLMNLLDNACEAVADSGNKRIEVTLKRFTADTGFLGRHAELQPGGHYACLTVADHGCGMDDTVQTRAFEPFYTTKDVGDGAGLGLSFVSGTVASHQGVVEMESAVDQGTRFRVYLPLAG